MRRKLDAKEEQKRIEEEIERIRLENESKVRTINILLIATIHFLTFLMTR